MFMFKYILLNIKVEVSIENLIRYETCVGIMSVNFCYCGCEGPGPGTHYSQTGVLVAAAS